MNEEKTALALGELIINFRNILLSTLPPDNGLIDFTVNTVFIPDFDGVAIHFTVGATCVDVKTGEVSLLTGEIDGHARMGAKR